MSHFRIANELEAFATHPSLWTEARRILRRFAADVRREPVLHTGPEPEMLVEIANVAGDLREMADAYSKGGGAAGMSTAGVLRHMSARLCAALGTRKESKDGPESEATIPR